jgi:hypothetical protein
MEEQEVRVHVECDNPAGYCPVCENLLFVDEDGTLKLAEDDWREGR